MPVPPAFLHHYTPCDFGPFSAEDRAIADAARMIALWPTISADRENLVRPEGDAC
jgi:hypothetical protein